MAAAVKRRDRNHDDGCDAVDEIRFHPESRHAHVRPPEDAHSYTHIHPKERKPESKKRLPCTASLELERDDEIAPDEAPLCVRKPDEGALRFCDRAEICVLVT